MPSALLGITIVLLFFVGSTPRAQQPAGVDDWINFDDSVGWESGCANVDTDLSCKFNLRIYGQIDTQTVTKVQKALAHRPPNWRFNVTLNSEGGDIDVAMKLGRVFREARARTQVEPTGSCQSACVLVFAGGVTRDTFGRRNIGIHRPALARVPQQTDMNAVKIATDDAVRRLRAYAAEMNISERLIDDMLVIPPEKIRWLSDEDRNAYGLGSMDPVYAETIVLDGAKRYGITPAEYRVRTERAKSECKDEKGINPLAYVGWSNEPLTQCHEAILSGKR